MELSNMLHFFIIRFLLKNIKMEDFKITIYYESYVDLVSIKTSTAGLMVEFHLAKVGVRVRFPGSAFFFHSYNFLLLKKKNIFIEF